MATNIFRPFKFGKETFHVQSFDENSLVMNYKMEAGGMVPPHKHIHMDEYFSVVKGEMKFKINGETFIKKAGEEIMVPRGTAHSIINAGKEQVELNVKYMPCADTHRMFEIIATLDESKPGSMINMLKYFYLAPRLELKEFSAPHPAFIFKIMNGIVTLTGKLSGWDKLINKFNDNSKY